MTREEMDALRVGQLIRHAHRANAYVVTANEGGEITATRVVTASNPSEWDAVDEAGRVISSIEGYPRREDGEAARG